MIGIVAAAFAHMPETLEILPMDRLLHPILNREVQRWRESSRSPEEFASVVSLIMVATLLQGLYLMTENDLVLLVNKEQQKALLVKNRETSLYEIPSVMWLHEHQPHLVQNALAGHGYKEIVSLLGTMIPPDKVRACLILAKIYVRRTGHYSPT